MADAMEQPASSEEEQAAAERAADGPEKQAAQERSLAFRERAASSVRCTQLDRHDRHHRKCRTL